MPLSLTHSMQTKDKKEKNVVNEFALKKWLSGISYITLLMNI